MADALLDRLDELATRMLRIENRLGAVEQALDWRRTVRAPELQAPSPPPPHAATPPPLPPQSHPVLQPITAAMLTGAAEDAQAAAHKRAVASAWFTGPIHPGPRTSPAATTPPVRAP